MAALPKIPFTVNVGSLRTDIDPRILPPGAGVLELENCVMSQTGAVSKRFGNTALSTTLIPSGTLADIWQLATHQGTLLSLSKVGATPLARYSPTVGLFENLSAAAAPTRGPITLGVSPYAGAANQANNADIAVSGNYTALAYEYALFNNLSIEDIIDGQTGKGIARATPAGVRIKVVLQNGCFVYVWVNPSTHDITFDKWVIATLGTVSTPVQVSAGASTHATNPFIDIQTIGADTIVVVYQHSDNTVHGIQYTVSTASAAAPFQFKDSAGATIAATQCLGWATKVFATGPTLLIADATAGVKAHVYNSGVTSNASVSKVIDAGATTNVRNVTGWTTAATDFAVLFETTGANGWLSKVNAGLSVGGVITTGIWHRGIVLRSKPLSSADGGIYVICAYDSTTQPMYVLMPVSADPVSNVYPIAAARFQTWSASGKTEKASYLSTLLTYQGGIIYPSVYRQRLETAAGVTYFDYGLSLKIFAFNDPALDAPNEAHGCLWTPGGILHCFDGVRYHEHTWHTYPEGLSVAYSNVGGNGLVAGAVYNWIAVYRWINAQGQIVRSVPSAPLQSTVTGGNNTATVTIPNARLTSIHDVTPQIELYRTAALGTAYFRVGNTQNNYSAATDNAIVDGVSDVNLSNGEALYAQPGGVLASQPPPPTSIVNVYDRRLWCVDAEDRTLLAFTNQFVDGVCAAFNETLGIRIADQYGDITQLATMDDKHVVFKEGAIYVINGIGPDTSGNGSYNPPQLICIGDGVARSQARSVIATNLGVFFLASRGICCLTRGLQVQFIGQPMQAYIAGFVCTGVVQMPDVNQIRWFSDNGTTIVYDYLHQVWGIHTNQSTIAVVLWNGLPVMADSQINLWLETAGTYLDRNFAFAQKVTLPNLSLAGLRGFERLYRVQGIGSCANATTTIGVNFVYDFDPSTAHEQNVTPRTLWDWEARPAKQTATTVKLTIRDLLAGPVGPGFVMNGVTLIYGQKTGLRPVAKTQRAV